MDGTENDALYEDLVMSGRSSESQFVMTVLMLIRMCTEIAFVISRSQLFSTATVT
ncbi:hypothetical protein DPMN_035166 [Dreissena polymorpha]|uniref:Uncharacterized protein n=1 Tax=Dreissena polymorpha TaxID=45954 RepID=A0A9D4RKC5_DREPO|nr:hypothetical protein DPMN_035166 [Dreissena polymorpha]